MTKLCLGTVQFGMRYGVNNQIGRQPTWDESFEMLDFAIDSGIDTIDTARAYGEAELILGQYFRERRSPETLKIISKLRPNVIKWDEPDVTGVVRLEVEDSLSRMGLNHLDGYLLHTPEYVYRPDIIAALCSLKDEGLVSNIGVSIYGLKEGYAALELGCMDYVQLPYNMLDQRGVREGFIQEARAQGLTIFTRSAFLQGLFMMSGSEVPPHLAASLPHLAVICQIANEFNVSVADLAIAFVRAEPEIDYLVFGVEKLSQLKEDLRFFAADDVPRECINELKNAIEDVEDAVIFPSLWSNGKQAE